MMNFQDIYFQPSEHLFWKHVLLKIKFLFLRTVNIVANPASFSVYFFIFFITILYNAYIIHHRVVFLLGVLLELGIKLLRLGRGSGAGLESNPAH
jgi:hypothetical protein